MRRSWLAIVLLLVLAGLGAWLAVWSGTVPPDAAAQTPAAAHAEPEEPAPASAPTEATPLPPAERSLAVVANEAPTAEAPRRLEGRVIVVEPDGREHAQCSGEIEIKLHVPREPTFVSLLSSKVEVNAGVWHVDLVPEATALTAWTMTLDGRPATSDDHVDLAGVIDEPIVVRATWQPTLRLRVLDEDTGAELAGITVLEVRYGDDLDPSHPGIPRGEPLLRDARSPIEITPTERNDTVHYLIKASGHAWRPIALAADSAGERVLRLPRAGDVEVRVVGDVPRGATLRLRPGSAAAPDHMPTDMPLGEFVLGSEQRVLVDALPPGDWSLSVEKGKWFAGGVLGHTTVSVVPDATVSATIHLGDAARPPEVVRVRGTLTLPARWGENVELELEPTGLAKAWRDRGHSIGLGRMQALGGDRYAWGEVPLVQGRWQLHVRGTEHRAVFDVGPGHPTHVDIVVAEPCELRVRVVDAETGATIPGAAPSFYSVPQGWFGGWHLRSLEAADADWYRGLSPPGTIWILAHPDGYLWSQEQYETKPGVNEFVVRIGRAQGVVITLMDGDVQVPWPDTLRYELRHTAADSGASYRSGPRIAAKTPGEHVLELSQIDGFRAIPPRRVTIEPGQWTEVAIALERAK